MDDHIEFRRLNGCELPVLKDLWLELNAYHIPVVTTFKDRFLNVSYEKHLQFLKNQEKVFAHVASSCDQIIGFIIVFACGNIAELDSIFVAKKYRGHGVGSVLVARALQELVGVYKEIVARVAEGNEQHFHHLNHFKKRYSLFQYDYGEEQKDGHSGQVVPWQTERMS